MFETIVNPVIKAVKSWMSRQVYQAAQDGAREGLARFAAQLAAAAELPIEEARPLAVPMPAVARVTAEAPGVSGDTPEPDGEQPCPALDVGKYERLKELVDGGLSQREAARQLGVPESTARSWLKRERQG